MQLADFHGSWTIDREIQDHLTGTVSHFKGTGVFSPDQDQTIYLEKGKLMLAGVPPMTSERRYFWRESTLGIDVFFDDNRPFHSFQFDMGQAAHWCDPDQYDVRYEFGSWPLWTSEWKVKGPRKSYTMHSAYSKPL